MEKSALFGSLVLKSIPFPINCWIKTLYLKTTLLLFLIFLISFTAQSQCPTFEFCMEAPYFDGSEHLYAIDVFVDGLATEEVTLINLEINYSNQDWIIDQTLTTASAYTGLNYLNAN